MTATTSPLRILHLVLQLRSTNSQYNEHSLPVADRRDITLCTFFVPELEPPASIAVVPGDGTVLGFFRALRRATRNGDHDAVHAHSPQAAVMLALAVLTRVAATSRGRTVLTVHDSYEDFKPRNKLLLLLAFPFFQRVVFCGHAAAASFPRWWRRLLGRRARTVDNGADVARIDRTLARLEARAPARGPGPGSARGPGAFTVLSIGRLEQVKDPITLLDAFARVQRPGTRLVVVGDGALREVVERAVVERGLRDAVTLTGLIDREEVFRWCTEADVFVSTSTGEGLPVAAMEAMASRLPVVLSDIPPHHELAARTSVVPLVPVGDADGFAAEIARLRDAPAEQRRSIGESCRRVIVEGFSLERMTAGYETVYRELVVERSS